MMYVITSGCSFSMAYDWARRVNKEIYTDKYLQEYEGSIYWYTHLFASLQKLYNTDFEFFNLGMEGAGQGWISRSIILKLTNLLNSGVDPKNIIVIPMWSGMLRKEILIDNDMHLFTDNKNLLKRKELWAFMSGDTISEIYTEQVINKNLKKLDPYYREESKWDGGGPNDYEVSVRFRDMKDSVQNNKENIKWDKSRVWRYWEQGFTEPLNSSNFTERSDYIDTTLASNNHMCKLVYTHFSQISLRQVYMENIEHILRLQWFCESKNIKLINICFKELFFDTNPDNMFLTKSIDFNKWHFHKDRYGMLEWVKDMCEIRQNYGEESRIAFHPIEIEHKQYAEKFLLPIIKENL